MSIELVMPSNHLILCHAVLLLPSIFPSIRVFPNESVPGISSVHFSSVNQSCPTLCNPMDYSTPRLPVHHQFPELAQTHVHQVRDAIQPIPYSVIPFSSCLQSFPALGSFPTNQFFTSGGQSIGSPALASVLLMNIQGWFSLGLTGLISLRSKGHWRFFFITPLFKSINSSVLSILYGPALTSIHDYWKNHSFD